MQDSGKDVPSEDLFIVWWFEFLKGMVVTRIVSGVWSGKGNEEELMSKMKEG